MASQHLDPPSAALNWKTEARSVDSLSATERAQMFQLMCEHFDGMDRAHFDHDLDEKQVVFCVTDQATGTILGFSTAMAIRATIDGKPITALFSGDTVVDERFANERQFLRVVGRWLFEEAARLDPQPVYWLLLTCTVRSYRFLPAFMREYYPQLSMDTPREVLERIEVLTRCKFPAEFDAERGVVALTGDQAVRPRRSEISSRHIDDPHVAYFVRANPGYVEGHFLACLSVLAPDNLTDLGRRLFGY